MTMINKAKIVATLGPASQDKSVMAEMIKEGVSVFRINFSHSNHQDARTIIHRVRELNDELQTNVAILADLQGPKLRLGEVEKNTIVEIGDTVIITNKEMLGNKDRIYITYEQFPKDVDEGDKILLDDGKIMLKAISTNREDEVVTEVVQGGPIKSKKGVNLPNTRISLPCLTPKDLADLEVALDENVEWIGLSFVRSPKDIQELKEIIRKHGAPSRVIAKIEKPEAVVEIDQIIEETDAIMVARGDLGVEVPMQGVPLIQKRIVNKGHKAAKPVIIATQMMESMIESMSPTRAEVNDVANSVLDGADAVMLSGETSVGKYPVHVIKAMTKIITHIEETADIHVKEENPPAQRDERFITDSICYNASKIADQVGAKGILTMTHSGYSAFKISSHRPKTNILVFTHNRYLLNMLSLLWGVRGMYYDKRSSTDETFKDIERIAKKNNILQKDDLAVKIASMPIESLGMTNTIKITKVE